MKDRRMCRFVLGPPYVWKLPYTKQGPILPGADIWSLGRVCYFTVTGKHPLEAASQNGALNYIRGVYVISGMFLKANILGYLSNSY